MNIIYFNPPLLEMGFDNVFFKCHNLYLACIYVKAAIKHRDDFLIKLKIKNKKILSMYIVYKRKSTLEQE